MSTLISSTGLVRFVLDHGPHVGQSRPAIIVRVINPTQQIVNMFVFPDVPHDQVAISFEEDVSYSPEHKPRTWHFDTSNER